MLKTISNAFEVVNTTLGKITKVSRPIRKFILHILPLWLAMNCRMVFMNMQRWAGRSEKSYRSMFSKTSIGFLLIVPSYSNTLEKRS